VILAVALGHAGNIAARSGQSAVSRASRLP
jgi:hypothetical protein